MKSSVYREVSGLMDLSALNTDSSTYQESKHEIYTMCTLLLHGNNSGLQKDQTASVMNVV